MNGSDIPPHSDATSPDSCDLSDVIDLASAAKLDAEFVEGDPLDALQRYADEIGDGLFAACGIMLDNERFRNN